MWRATRSWLKLALWCVPRRPANGLVMAVLTLLASSCAEWRARPDGRAEPSRIRRHEGAASPGTAVQAHIVAGQTYGLTGRHAEAAAEYEEALRLDPGRTDARLNLALAYKALRRYDDAIDALRTVMQNDPTLRVPAAIDLGTVYEDLEQPAQAIAAYRLAVTLDSASAPAHYALGRAALLAGDRATAEEEHRTLLELDHVWALRLQLLLTPPR